MTSRAGKWIARVAKLRSAAMAASRTSMLGIVSAFEMILNRFSLAPKA
jgi:hypothetical protein